MSHGLAVILYEMTGPALQPAWGIGSLTRPWIPHGIHHGSQDIERDPGLPCGGQSGILDPVRNPEFRPSSNAGSFTCDVFHSVRYPTLYLGSEVKGGPLGGVPP